MSEQNNQPEDPPLDDYGIDHDRILEICEKIIEKIHTKYVLEEKEPASPSEYKDIIQSVESCWFLTKEILDLDDVINSASESLIKGEIPKYPGTSEDLEEENPEDPENPDNPEYEDPEDA